MQLTGSTTIPQARKSIVAVLAVVAAAAGGVGLAAVTSDGTSPEVVQRVTSDVSSLPQGNEGKAAAPAPQSSSPVDDRIHGFQYGGH